jgi:hypothetical protein
MYQKSTTLQQKQSNDKPSVLPVKLPQGAASSTPAYFPPTVLRPNLPHIPSTPDATAMQTDSTTTPIASETDKMEIDTELVERILAPHKETLFPETTNLSLQDFLLLGLTSPLEKQSGATISLETKDIASFIESPRNGQGNGIGI